MTENQILDFVQQYGSLKKAIENMDEVDNLHFIRINILQIYI